jgi:RNA polymerase sigma factor (sigma-70 family)
MAKGLLDPILWHLRKLTHVTEASNATDGQLLRRFATQRDEEAFAALVWRHGPMVYGVCRRVLHDPHDAADAFQATFLVLVQKATSIHKRAAVGSWLFGVARRSATEAKVRAARRRRRERRAEATPPTDPQAETARRELRQVLDEELARLPAKYRAPLVLHYLEGQTKGKTAQQLGWTEGTVSGRLARAREVLAVRLARRGVTLSAGLVATVVAGEAVTAAAPTPLALATIQGALGFTVEGATAGAFPAPVVALAQAVLHHMFLAKWPIAAAVVLAVSVAGLSLSVLAHPLNDHPAVAAGEAIREGTNGDLPKPSPVPGSPRESRRHGEVTAVAFSRDGKKLVSVGRDHNVQLWNVATQRVMDHWEKPEWKVVAVTFSPDGKLLAFGTGPDEEGGLWAPEFGWFTKLGRLTRDRSEVATAAFSPDGKVLAVAGSFAPILWDPAAPQKLSWNGALNTPGGVSALAFSPDGTWFAWAARDNLLRLCELTNDKNRFQDWNTTRLGKITSLTFGPDGRTLAAGTVNGTLVLWEVIKYPDTRRVRQLQEIQRFQLDHQPSVSALAIAAAGQTLISRYTDGTTGLWDVATGRPLPSLAQAHPGGVSVIALAPDGKTLASGGKDGVIHFSKLPREK